MEQSVTLGLREEARRHRLTLNTLVQGAWALLLKRYGLGPEVVFGVTSSGRPAALPDAAEMIGLFINTLPLRLEVDESLPVHVWLNRIRDEQLQILQFEQSPLARVNRWSGVPPGEPLFDSILVFENYGAPAAEDGDPITWSSPRVREHSHFPMAVLVLPGERLRLVLIHDRSRFDEPWTRQCARHLATLLEAMAQGLERSAAELPLMSPEETHQIISAWGRNPVSLPPADNWLDLFERQARQWPDAIALTDARGSLTYAELDRFTSITALRMAAAGAGRGTRIALYSDWSLETIVGLLAILKAGAAYVPLDASYPADWVQQVLQDAAPAFVLCRRELAAQWTPNLPWLPLELTDDPVDRLPPRPSSDDPAYVIYTSGSSGGPKGVRVTHSNLLHSTLARQHYYAAPVRAFLLLSSFAFDSSVAGIFWTLASGGTLCVPPQDRYRDMAEMAEWITRFRISHLLCVPTIHSHLLEDVPDSLQGVEAVIVAGETCPPHLVRRHFDRLPGISLFNEYGPTEATVWATVHRCSPADARGIVPIGRPIPNTSVLVLDPDGRPLPAGIPGELAIGGPGVAAGYWQRSNQTATRFVELPALSGRWYRTGDLAAWRRDGVLVFLGRTDDQIKVLGLRVEAGQIAEALQQVPGVAEAEVLFTPAHEPALETFEDAVLMEGLRRLGPQAGEALLAEVEGAVAPAPPSDHPARSRTTWERDQDRFRLTLTAKSPSFIDTPRSAQRDWLLHQALDEFRDDLQWLDQEARKLVPGAGTRLLDETSELADAALADQDIMEDWQIPLMRAMAERVAREGGDVLEIGFGRGVAATFIQERGVRSHTIVEINPAVIQRHYEPWRRRHQDRSIELLQGGWRELEDRMATYDGVLFHAVPLNPDEYLRHIVSDVTFAAHFFPTAARILRQGGSFTYLTTEIDSLARRHQRLLLQYFSRIELTVVPLEIPPGTRDAWWANSMVVLKAAK
jgi:amino acid adenylation domain-containing protein